MKNILRALIVAAVLSVSSAFAQTGPVFLNNFDSNHAILNQNGSLATGVFIQLFAGANINSLSLVTSSGGQSTFQVVEPGFFDSGYGYTQLANGSSGVFRLVAWTGAADFASAQVRGSVEWTQTVGTQNPGSPLPPASPAALNNPVLQLAAVPEPTTVALAVMGGLGLLARRRRNANA